MIYNDENIRFGIKIKLDFTPMRAGNLLFEPKLVKGLKGVVKSNWGGCNLLVIIPNIILRIWKVLHVSYVDQSNIWKF